VEKVDVDLGEIRERLRPLEWGDGLSRTEIKRQWQDMPDAVYGVLPTDFVFRNEGEVMSYLAHLRRHGAVAPLPELEPHGYGPSPTGTSVARAPTEHGVGSGTDTGYTGGGSVQTGVGRSGTTYGHEEK